MNIPQLHRAANGWSLTDIKGISANTFMHRIFIEENAKPSRETQRQLNPIEVRSGEERDSKIVRYWDHICHLK